jgi:hypothetical protein
MMVTNVLIALFLHPIHVSVTEMEYSEKNKSLQITTRIFIDDLELSIRKQTGLESLDLIEPQNGMKTDQLVEAYLKEHFKVMIDGKPAKINYLASELEEPAIICYLEIENIKKLKTITVTNTALQETHDDQSNLVHITYRSPVKSYRLVREKPTETYKFEPK